MRYVLAEPVATSARNSNTAQYRGITLRLRMTVNEDRCQPNRKPSRLSTIRWGIVPLPLFPGLARSEVRLNRRASPQWILPRQGRARRRLNCGMDRRYKIGRTLGSHVPVEYRSRYPEQTLPRHRPGW